MPVTILGPVAGSGASLRLYSSKVSAGFPSPAQDHLEREISLDEILQIRAPHTYLVRAGGDSMIRAGIHDGDLMVVDRSREAEPGDIVIAAVNGDLFAEVQSERATKAMAVMDAINARWGRGTVRPGGVPAAPEWGMRRELMSRSYTTRLDELWEVQ
ncbi:S24 family peptidase [Pseudomonas aeruginosa]|uniref:S24 family peptidase n=4 Tax=Pseudomonas TaxID=286 RepID=UPI0009A4E05E|nr:S24 family peptidase [Pseudomonas aeruginosa]